VAAALGDRRHRDADVQRGYRHLDHPLMPLQRCTTDGKPGWKYGDSGACYVYTSGDDASEKEAKRKAVKQAIAIGGGKAPKDLSDTEVDDLLAYAEDFDADDLRALAAVTVDPSMKVPDGVARCTMNGTPGFRGMGGPTSACHVHDGTPAGMRSAIAKALRDRGTANPPPRGSYAELETEDLTGVPLMASGGPYHGQGSPPDGDFFDDDYLNTVARETAALADEVRIPIKLGHNRAQKLLKNSGLFADEQPAAGWVNARNLRVANGQLLGDLQRVPKKLAQLIKTGAFRTRSVELSRVKSQKRGGEVFENVITGLALLGAKAPAIRTLDDIVALYAEDEDRNAARFDDGVEAQPLVIYSTTVQMSDGVGDTSPVSTEAKTQNPTLTDEQVQSFATAFGIDEQDADKRRAAVLDKFKEFVPETSSTPAGETSTPPTAPPEPTTPPAPSPAPEPSAPASSATPVATPGAVLMSEAEVKQLKDDAALGKRAFTDQLSQRISANVALAVKQGRISAKDADEWRGFMERDYEFAVKQLAHLPVQERLLRTYGSDENGESPAAKAEDAMYASFAAATGVPRRITTPVGGAA
jgi:hypothetical protein